MDPANARMNVLEYDELWSFVRKRTNKVWVWVALYRETCQIVAIVTGDRSAGTCRNLWEAIPERFRHSHCTTDFWEAYAQVIPPEQHTARGRDEGGTHHLERWNNTPRQRLARFVRRTLSFSKSDEMHTACLLLCVHRYNRERADLWLRLHPPLWSHYPYFPPPNCPDSGVHYSPSCSNFVSSGAMNCIQVNLTILQRYGISSLKREEGSV